MRRYRLSAIRGNRKRCEKCGYKHTASKRYCPYCGYRNY